MISLERIHALLFFLAVFAVTMVNPTFAQRGNVLTLRLDSVPSNHASDTIYVAGNFNEWNPSDSNYILVPDSAGVRSLLLKGLQKDVYEFKLTRGNWNRVQIKSDGSAVDNSIIRIESDTTVFLKVEAWQDDFKPVERVHTLSANVRVMDTAFNVPQLKTTRRIWVYLPPGYAKAKYKKRYPVLYMHDGQNLFDTYTSGYGEWGIDEALDSLIIKGQPPAIVVGIDNGQRRMNEYNPYDFERFGKGEGEEYIDFIVKTLKPYIDKKFRTRPGRENTLIAGSSMGGLISFYALLSRPHVFSKAGVFSPAFWTAPEIKNFTDSAAVGIDARIFFYMGGLEGGTYVSDMEVIADKIGERSNALIYSVIDPESRHNEAAWRKWFPEFYIWIMSDGLNTRLKLEEDLLRKN